MRHYTRPIVAWRQVLLYRVTITSLIYGGVRRNSSTRYCLFGHFLPPGYCLDF